MGIVGTGCAFRVVVTICVMLVANLEDSACSTVGWHDASASAVWAMACIGKGMYSSMGSVQGSLAV